MNLRTLKPLINDGHVQLVNLTQNESGNLRNIIIKSLHYCTLRVRRLTKYKYDELRIGSILQLIYV